MKSNRLITALPLACLFAAGAALAAGESTTESGSTSSDPGYSTNSSDRSMNADPSRPNDTMSNETPSSSDRSMSRSGAGMSDAAITAKVKSALLAERGLPSSQIKVQTNDGVVQLSGFLNSQDEIDRAVSVARNVKDVKSVENNMQTK
ncbi:MAG TPA: BON domain-containing protein [Rhodocyclaceae bacterium]